MRLRRVLIAIATVFVLVVLALGVFVATFDANRFKPTIVELVEKHTGRQLTIAGDLSLSVWPRIALSIGPAQLSGPKGSGEFARIESARIGVALRPLLARRVEVEHVALDGLKLDAIRHRDGSTNFDDLLASMKTQPGGAVPSAPASPADAASAAATTVSVAAVALRNASLGWRDESTGAEWRLQELALEADRIGSGEPGRLEASGRLSGTKPVVDAGLKLTSGYRADFATGRIELVGAKLDARTSDGIDAHVDVPALSIADGGIDGEPISLRLQGERDATKLDAALAVRVVAPANEPIALRDLRVDLGASGAALPPDGVQASFAGAGVVDPKRKTAALTLKGTLDGSPVQARLTAPGLSPLVLQYDVQADRLDVDRYGAGRPAPAKNAGDTKTAPERTTSGTTSGTTRAPAAGAEAIPVPPIADVDTSGSIRIGALRAAGVDATDVTMTLRSGKGRIDVTRLVAALYGGTLAGNASLATSGRAALKMQLNGIDVGAALRQFAQREILDGRGNVSLDVHGTGTTIPALERSLAGSARIALRDGAIRGIDLGKVLQQVQTTIAAVRGGGASALEQQSAGGEKTAFSSLDASFAIRDGVAHNDDLDVRSPLLRVGGSGRIDLPDSTLDYLLRISLVGTLAGQGGAERSALRGVTIPVRVRGPMASLSYRVEVADLARDAVKQELTRQIEERLLGREPSGATPDAKPGQSAKPDPRDLLRGLIGR